MNRQRGATDPERDSNTQETMLVGGATIHPDPPGWSDRLDLPLVAPEPDGALDVAQPHLVEPDLTLDSPAHADRSRTHRQDAGWRVVVGLDVEIGRRRHRHR